MRIFLTGASGQLGRALLRALERHDVVAPLESEADITDSSIIDRVVGARPQVVIHAAAYTDVDGAETHPDTAFLVNAVGSRYIARGAMRAHARLIAVSTDYVYDGSKRGAYVESDPVAPLGVYGASKLEGEQEVLAADPSALVLRTAWLYGEGKNFVTTILRLASEKEELRVVDDQIGSPTSAVDLAGAIVALLDIRCVGVHHAVNAGSCSWYTFSREILRLAHLDRRILPIPSVDLARPARRPANSMLDCAKLAALGVMLRPWREALAEYMKSLQRSA